jgi:hypothetical protein
MSNECMSLPPRGTCEECLNTRLIVSENGFHRICTFPVSVSIKCIHGIKDRFIPLRAADRRAGESNE